MVVRIPPVECPPAGELACDSLRGAKHDIVKPTCHEICEEGRFGVSPRSPMQSLLRVAEYLTPVLAASQFLEKGVLTPDEFVAAGDQLVFSCPTWSWCVLPPAVAWQRGLERWQGLSFVCCTVCMRGYADTIVAVCWVSIWHPQS